MMLQIIYVYGVDFGLTRYFMCLFPGPAESSTFDIIFQADTHISGRGYFAEFEVNIQANSKHLQ